MTPLHEVIINKKTTTSPIWIMRQAGRYLPEFREIRKNNSNFIELCLNDKLSSKITLQPIKRFGLDAAIIFSDILLVPLVAFDKDRNRIGYGGGFYDRYIKKLKRKKKILTIGLAYSFQKVKKIPVTKHDIQLDFIVTNTTKAKN